MSKFTQMQWAFDDDDGAGPIVVYMPDAPEDERDGVCVLENDEIPRADLVAIAKLITAAPSMLRVLEDFATAKPEDLATLLMTKLNAMNIVTMLKGAGDE